MGLGRSECDWSGLLVNLASDRPPVLLTQPDENPGFVEAISDLVHLQEPGITVSAPAIGLDARELIRVSGVDIALLKLTFSCHIGEVPCGRCKGCMKRSELLGGTP